jgi:hypothetical protein
VKRDVATFLQNQRWKRWRTLQAIFRALLPLISLTDNLL